MSLMTKNGKNGEEIVKKKKGEHEYSAAARAALDEIKNVMLPVLET
jgi:hypothetical protein